MVKIQIKSIWGKLLFEYEKENNTIKDTVLEANFRGADLHGADLCEANLCGANLCEANLCEANLCRADLRGADLRGANLCEANLCRADLHGANLCGADLRGADLHGANLCGADLRGANLCRADLRGAGLCEANLCRADLTLVKINESTSNFLINCPEEGSFIAFKKCQGKIVKLLILEDANRSSATTLKCRASKVKTLEIEGGFSQISSDWDSNFIYKVGEISEVSNFDEDRWNECSAGIHFFLSKEMAKQY